MVAKKLITDGVLPLSPDDKGRDALEYMEDLHVSHLPLVKDKKLIGLVSEYDVYNADNLDLPVGKLPLSFLPFVYENQHVFEVLRMFGENNLTLLPVLDEYDNYVGTINQESLIEYLTGTYSVKEPGGVIVLEMHINDYVLSEIARIVESNDAKVLSLMMHSETGSAKIMISLKLNKIDISPVLQTFNRFGYEVVASFWENKNQDDLRSRYDEFMKYLSM